MDPFAPSANIQPTGGILNMLGEGVLIARSGPDQDLGHRQRTGSFVSFNVILNGELVVATKSRLALMPESGPRSDVSRASFKCVLEGRKEGRKYYFNRSDPIEEHSGAR
ncbi:hypothetical protein DFH09DRAFT_1073274 [Mycena vulgaris]|nr:hypothetical protein DFH09DRAFT_1073274 [Mycena vulgaris]